MSYIGPVERDPLIAAFKLIMYRYRLGDYEKSKAAPLSGQNVPLPYCGTGYTPWWLGFQPRHPGSSFAKWPEHLRMRPK